MEARNHLLGKPDLNIHRIEPLLDITAPFLNRADILSRQELKVTPHELVGDRHKLAELLFRAFVNTDVIIERFRHLLHAVGPFEDRQRHDHLWWLSIYPLQLAPD